MLRLFIVLPVYVVTASFLPRLTLAQPLFEALLRVETDIALMVSGGALALAIAGLYVLGRRSRAQPTGAEHPGLAILRMALIGLVFSGAYDLFSAMSGRAISPVGLVLVTFAFAVAEAVYQAVLWAMRRATRDGNMAASEAVSAPETEATSEDNRGLRLVVTVPVYIFVLVFVPELEAYKRLVAPFSQVSPPIVTAISVAALSVAGAVLYAVAYRDALAATPIVRAATGALSVGMIFAGVINIVGYAARYQPEISDLVLIPLGFAAAELIYLAILWRMTRGPVEL